MAQSRLSEVKDKYQDKDTALDQDKDEEQTMTRQTGLMGNARWVGLEWGGGAGWGGSIAA